jgi:mono/diheme cytochrome c family protein
MAAAIFLGFFIVLGLGVVLVAMRGGPRGVRETLEVGRRRPLHAAEFAVAGAIAVFGIAVPAIVLLGDQASAGPGGSQLTADQQQGRELFARRCATCHTLKDAAAVGKVGPNLDVLHPPKGLILDAIKNGRARGQGQMPAGVVDGQDAQNVAAYVAAVAGQSQ